MGLGTVTHFYGHFESMLKNGRTHPFPDDYNYNDEQSRWRPRRQGHRLHVRAAARPQWWAYLNEQKANGVTFGPTMSVYEAGRDLMRARTPGVARERTRCRRSGSSGSPTARTTAPSTTTGRPRTRCRWKRFIHRYMQLVNDYKSIGGRVAGGTDAGFIYSLYGFAAIRELELMQEAGFTANEAISAYTRQAARTLDRAARRRARVRHGPPRPDGRPDRHAREPAGELQDALRHRHRCGSTTRRASSSASAASAGRSATASSMTPSSCWPTSPRWCRRRRTPAAAPASTSTGARPAPAAAPGRRPRR